MTARTTAGQLQEIILPPQQPNAAAERLSRQADAYLEFRPARRTAIYGALDSG